MKGSKQIIQINITTQTIIFNHSKVIGVGIIHEKSHKLSVQWGKDSYRYAINFLEMSPSDGSLIVLGDLAIWLSGSRM